MPTFTVPRVDAQIEHASTPDNDFVRSGLVYVEYGFPVVPLYPITADGSCACPTKGCDNAGRHPRIRWRNLQPGDAGPARDQEALRLFDARFPGSGVGVLLGDAVDGRDVIVIDIDTKNGVDGNASLLALQEQLRPLSATVICVTGSGAHLYFVLPLSVSRGAIGNSTSDLAPGVDSKCSGGLVVGAGSPHASGGTYAWAAGGALGEIDIAELPERWAGRLLELSPASRRTSIPASAPGTVLPIEQAIDDSKRPTGPISKGTRNDTLFRYASYLRQLGGQEEQLREHLTTINDTLCRPKMSETEVEHIVTSALRYEWKKGRGTVMAMRERALDLPGYSTAEKRTLLAVLDAAMESGSTTFSRSQASIAELATSTAPTVNRHLKKFRDDGLLSYHKPPPSYVSKFTLMIDISPHSPSSGDGRNGTVDPPPFFGTTMASPSIASAPDWTRHSDDIRHPAYMHGMKMNGEVMAALRAVPTATPSQIAEVTGRNVRTIRDTLKVATSDPVPLATYHGSGIWQHLITDEKLDQRAKDSGAKGRLVKRKLKQFEQRCIYHEKHGPFVRTDTGFVVAGTGELVTAQSMPRILDEHYTHVRSQASAPKTHARGGRCTTDQIAADVPRT